MESEKKSVALWSGIAAIFITSFKIIVGLLTGSIAILSEALHSALDLVATFITYYSVSVSDKPSDEDHHFGHGKIENLSAFIETILLFLTCIWIIYESASRLISGNTEIEVNFWSYLVVSVSIIVDITRSRALAKAAKKHNSQALEADALHFSTDIWSSGVVLLGLICADFGFFYADSIAAIFVALIVFFISFKLGKRSVDVLLDKAPTSLYQKIEKVLCQINDITKYHDVKIRTSGASTFVEVNIHVNPELNIAKAHEISHKVEAEICRIVDKCEVHVHIEPDNINH